MKKSMAKSGVGVLTWVLIGLATLWAAGASADQDPATNSTAPASATPRADSVVVDANGKITFKATGTATKKAKRKKQDDSDDSEEVGESGAPEWVVPSFERNRIKVGMPVSQFMCRP